MEHDRKQQQARGPGKGVNMDADYYKADQAAAKLGISLDTLYRELKKEPCTIPHKRVGSQYLILKSWVDTPDRGQSSA